MATKTKTENLMIRVSPELKERVKAAADEKEQTLSVWITEAIRAALKRQAKDER